MKKLFTNQRLNGFVVSNLVAFCIIWLDKFIMGQGNSVLVYSEFVIIPMLMGIICAWFWRNLNLAKTELIIQSCFNCFIAIMLSFVFLGEGVICLIIVSPLLLLFINTGAFLGRVMFRNNNQKLNMSMLSLLLLVMVNDLTSKHQYENEVSDTILIHAPANKVWKNVVAFKPIKQENSFWLFKIGLPSPMATTVDGYYKGAGRKCIFSNGYTFGEQISVFEPGRDLVFDIINQPRDPEIMNHLDLLKGEFNLKDNGDGTTTLTGNSWYKLYVFPTWYYDLWAQNIVRNVHVRVMQHIKVLSEQAE
jgi:uncharacterized membrane protein YsdA (DUF1294 family)/uncharacterized protein YndB with AHSA1/START domain